MLYHERQELLCEIIAFRDKGDQALVEGSLLSF